MSSGAIALVSGVVAIILGQLPGRWRPYIQGAGRTRLQTVWGAVLIVAGIVLRVT